MSEWISVIAVFWLLWAIDGARLLPWRAYFALVGGWQKRPRGGLYFSRVLWSDICPASFRVLSSDVLCAFSPAGICNRPAGAAGRPAEADTVPLRAWRWEEIREVGIAKGWVFVNGVRFMRHTGHVTPKELLHLAHLDAAKRERRLRWLLARWMRPAHLQRRARVLMARTRWITGLNLLTALTLAAVSIYVLTGGAGKVGEYEAARIAAIISAVLGAAFAAHLAATISAMIVVRKLKPVALEKRGTTLFSALLLPPQALRLRMVLSDGFFPVQHPLGLALAFGREPARKEIAFQTVADLRWPLPAEKDTPLLAVEVLTWFRKEWGGVVEKRLKAAEVSVDELLAAPKPDGSGNQAYCPRCRDQFVECAAQCPHGVALKPFPKAKLGQISK